MAIMYPKVLPEVDMTDSERFVYLSLKKQLSDSYEVFYSVKWTKHKNGKPLKSEADFIVTHPDYGFLCLEVKGGSKAWIENGSWHVYDEKHGDRKLTRSPYDQADESMYYFKDAFVDKYNTTYGGIYGSAAVFPFYAISQDMNLNHRDRICTIDSNDMINLERTIIRLFKFWGGVTFGSRLYLKSQHKAMMELIRERIAISAAAGAVIKYKEHQMTLVNRVQDGYVYLLSNVNRMYIKGGAGTGKTWIATKMAIKDADAGKKVLFLCKSPLLAKDIRSRLSSDVDIFDIKDFLEKKVKNFEVYSPPFYKGIGESGIIVADLYDSIYIDEAQDFTEEWAEFILKFLIDKNNSRLCVFYDDVQILREDSFGNGFGINTLPYLLHENIRNTANIYSWASTKTKLGKDLLLNPVEGPDPITEFVKEKGIFEQRIGALLKKFIVDENVPNTSVVILVPDSDDFLKEYTAGIANWRFVKQTCGNNDIMVASIEDYKGLESDMIIYIHDGSCSDNMNYIAYTRAKYFLIEMVRLYDAKA